MKFLSPDSKVTLFLTKVADMMILNILFIISCIPVFTLGAAITALYRTVMEYEKPKAQGLIKLYFCEFRRNFKKATLLFLILLVPVAITLYEAVFYLIGTEKVSSLSAFIFLFPLFIVTGIVSYVYPLQSKFENTIKNTLRNAFIMVWIHLPITAILVAVNLLLPALMFLSTQFFLKISVFWLLIGFSLQCELNSIFLLKVFKKYYDEPVDEDDFSV